MFGSPAAVSRVNQSSEGDPTAFFLTILGCIGVLLGLQDPPVQASLQSLDSELSALHNNFSCKCFQLSVYCGHFVAEHSPVRGTTSLPHNIFFLLSRPTFCPSTCASLRCVLLRVCVLSEKSNLCAQNITERSDLSADADSR